jgi:hypothetical protein
LILIRSGHFRCDLRNFEFLFIRGAGKQALKVQRRRNPLEHSPRRYQAAVLSKRCEKNLNR